jgi:hypothetical protein
MLHGIALVFIGLLVFIAHIRGLRSSGGVVGFGHLELWVWVFIKEANNIFIFFIGLWFEWNDLS